MSILINKNATNKRVSGKLGGLFCLNRTDSGLIGLFGRDRSDPAAHVKHSAQLAESKGLGF